MEKNSKGKKIYSTTACKRAPAVQAATNTQYIQTHDNNHYKDHVIKKMAVNITWKSK